MSPSFRRFLIRLLRTYVLLLVVIFFGQRWLLYHPTRSDEPSMVEQAKVNDLMPWKDASGTIVGWQRDVVRASKPANKMIVFHGNAGSSIDREYYVTGFEALDSGRTWEVFLFEYPGYGARGGKPNRASINTAAHAAARELLAQDDRPLFLLGESLGGGAAAYVAALEQERVKGVIMMTPFARLTEVAQDAVPFIPAGLLLRDRWDNIAALAVTRVPVAVLIAGRDEVLGPAQGEKLFASLGDRPKQRWHFPEARHNTMEVHPGAAWWREVSEFLLRNPSAPAAK